MSSDVSMVNSIMMPNAIAVYIGSGGSFTWSVQFDASSYDSVEHMVFNPAGDKIVVGLKPFGIAVLLSSTGSVWRAY